MKPPSTITLAEKGNIYFASDFHLGVPDYESSLGREKKLISWLESIREDASVIFLMGDIFDFWFEYKTVVPKGYTRLLGKLAELTDAGIEIHLFRGNHDIWAFDYFQKELNIQLHRKAVITTSRGKTFFLAHGDGLGPGDNGYKFLKKVFELKLNQWLFKWIHPDWGTRLGLYFSRRSRIANMAKAGKKENNIPLEKEMLYVYSKSELEKNPAINYFILGHRHIPLQHQLNNDSELIILGDWIAHFSYAVFDGKKMELKYYSNEK